MNNLFRLTLIFYTKLAKMPLEAYILRYVGWFLAFIRPPVDVRGATKYNKKITYLKLVKKRKDINFTRSFISIKCK